MYRKVVRKLIYFGSDTKRIESSGQLLRHLDPSAKYFAVFDAVSGFHQIPISPESSKLLNITTQMGNYRYTVLAQGLCASQDLFNIITKGETQVNPDFKIIKNVDDFCIFWVRSG